MRRAWNPEKLNISGYHFPNGEKKKISSTTPQQLSGDETSDVKLDKNAELLS